MKLMHFIVLAVVLSVSLVVYDLFKPIPCVEKRFDRIAGCVPESWVEVPKKERFKYRRALKRAYGIAPPIAHALQEPDRAWFTSSYATINMLPGVSGEQMRAFIGALDQKGLEKMLRKGFEKSLGLSDFIIESAEYDEDEGIAWMTVLYTSVNGEETRQVSAMIMEEGGVFAVDFCNPEGLLARVTEWQYRDLIRTFQIL
jgi:hypothetical protein